MKFSIISCPTGKTNTKITLQNTKSNDYKNQRYLTLNQKSLVSSDVENPTDR